MSAPGCVATARRNPKMSKRVPSVPASDRHGWGTRFSNPSISRAAPRSGRAGSLYPEWPKPPTKKEPAPSRGSGCALLVVAGPSASVATRAQCAILATPELRVELAGLRASVGMPDGSDAGAMVPTTVGHSARFLVALEVVLRASHTQLAAAGGAAVADGSHGDDEGRVRGPHRDGLRGGRLRDEHRQPRRRPARAGRREMWRPEEAVWQGHRVGVVLRLGRCRLHLEAAEHEANLGHDRARAGARRVGPIGVMLLGRGPVASDVEVGRARARGRRLWSSQLRHFRRGALRHREAWRSLLHALSASDKACHRSE
mmetsp:Transcript_36457/g.103716  ORF Transcript_36457/g.103716 Transcript_36457/m.103716 type:complete len:314 (+) Transcript_36457:334-1275(+)